MSLLEYYTALCPHEPEWVLLASLPRERQVELLEMRASEHRGQLQAVEAALAEMEATK